MKERKIDAKFVSYLIVGCILGVAIALTMSLGLKFNIAELLSQYGTVIIYGVIGLILTLLGCAFIILIRILRLAKQTFEGKEEDRVEEIKYKGIADYSALTTAAFYLSIIPLVTTQLELLSNVHYGRNLLIALLVLITVASMFYTFPLARKLNPERKIPKMGEHNWEKKYIEGMDEGEKFVTFQGLYKAYQLCNTLFVISMFLAVIYSAITKQSQLFSIILIILVMMTVNITYYLTVRKNIKHKMNGKLTWKLPISLSFLTFLKNKQGKKIA